MNGCGADAVCISGMLGGGGAAFEHDDPAAELNDVAAVAVGAKNSSPSKLANVDLALS